MTALTLPRRTFLAGSGLSMLGALTATRAASAQQRSEGETRNVALVNDFCAAWSTRDLQRVTALDGRQQRLSHERDHAAGDGARGA